MPVYKIRDDNTGIIHEVEMDSEPTPEDVEEIFAQKTAPQETTPFTRMQANAARVLNPQNKIPMAIRAPLYVAEQVGATAGVIPHYAGKALGAAIAPVTQFMSGVGGKFAQKEGMKPSVLTMPASIADIVGGAVQKLPADVKELGQGVMDVASYIPGGAAAKPGLYKVGVKAADVAADMTMKRLALKAKDMKKYGDDFERVKKVIVDNNLVGNSAKTFHEKAQTIISDAAQQLDAVIKKDPALNVNLETIATRAVDRLKTQQPLAAKKYQPIYDEMLDNLEEGLGIQGKNLKQLSLTDAQQIKRAIGAEADWERNAASINKSLDYKKSDFYNIVYDELKKEIEGLGGPEVKALNKKMSDLITLDRAAVKRMVVEQRKNPLSLTATLSLVGSAASGNLMPLAVLGADVASKSPIVAKTLYKAGKTMQSVGKPQSIRELLKR